MSYDRDLDEYSTDRLEAELQARRKARHDQQCDYCFRPLTSEPCKFADERHVPQEETPLDNMLSVVASLAEIIHGWPAGRRNTYCPNDLLPMARSLKYCETIVKALVGDGYTLIFPGTITREGDEYLATFKRGDGTIARGWLPIPNPGWMVGGGSAFARRPK